MTLPFSGLPAGMFGALPSGTLSGFGSMAAAGLPEVDNPRPGKTFFRDVGRLVHVLIQGAYLSEHRTAPVICERRLFMRGLDWRVSSILEAAGAMDPAGGMVWPVDRAAIDAYTYELASITARNGRLRPDILDLKARTLYEIKPRTEAQAGIEQMLKLLGEFNALASLTGGDAITPGMWFPPPIFYLGYNLYSVNWLQAPGLILYRIVSLRGGQSQRAASALRVDLADLRTMADEERELGKRLQLQQKVGAVATALALVALLHATASGGGRGGGNAGTGGRGADVIRLRPRQPAGGQQAAEIGQAAAAIMAPIFSTDLLRDAESEESQPTRGWSPLSSGSLAGVLQGAPPAGDPKDAGSRTGASRRSPEQEFLYEVARALVVRLPAESAATWMQSRRWSDNPNAPIVPDAEQYPDPDREMIVARQTTVAYEMLGALSRELGGINRLIELFPGTFGSSPLYPEDLAERLSRERELVTPLEVLEWLLESPEGGLEALAPEDASASAESYE